MVFVEFVVEHLVELAVGMKVEHFMDLAVKMEVVYLAP